jgi:DNA-binding transcriptional ArsR family regulator
MSLDDALIALGDPTRRAVLERLVKGPCALADLAQQMLPVSRPAVAQHLKVLEEAGLVTCTKDGIRQFFAVDLERLVAVRDYFNGVLGEAVQAMKAAAEPEKPQPSWRRRF